MVRVIDDMAEVYSLQKETKPGWNDDMALVCSIKFSLFSLVIVIISVCGPTWSGDNAG